MVSREVGVELYRLEAWQARARAGLELGLKAQGGEPLAAELDAAKRHIGELSMEIELWVANYYSARNPLRLSSLVILGVVARMFRCATRSSCWCT